MPTEETTNTQETQPANPSAETKNTEQQPAENMIPQSRFNELNKQLKEAKAALEAHQKQQGEAEKAKLAEQQRFQELYETEQKKATALEGRLTELQATVRRNTIRAVIEAEARKANFAEPADAHLFLDLDGIETDDSGKPKGVDVLVKELAKAKSYLLQTQSVQHGNGKLPKPAGQGGDAEKLARATHDKWAHNQF